MKEHTSTASSSARQVADRRLSDVCEERRDFARAARFYLQLDPKQLPSRFLYDALGSALFDAICHLPWYRITRAELQLLQRHAATFGHVFREGGRVVELGCGNGEKLATLLTHADVPGVHAHLIDLSEAALARSVQTLAAIEGLEIRVTTHQAPYEDGLLALPTENAHPTLVAFLGSNIGNFDPPGAAEFLHDLRTSLNKDDGLLIGVDLVKPRRQLLLAYDDPLGVTAAFNRTLLVRINRELGAAIDLDGFSHRALWNEAESRVEMHLVARSPQPMSIPRAHTDIHLDAGEAIWTESSYKYAPEQIAQLLRSVAFEPIAQWIDQQDGFALTLAKAA